MRKGSAAAGAGWVRLMRTVGPVESRAQSEEWVRRRWVRTCHAP